MSDITDIELCNDSSRCIYGEIDGVDGVDGCRENTILERYSSGFGNEIKQDFKEGGILNGKNYSGGDIKTYTGLIGRHELTFSSLIPLTK